MIAVRIIRRQSEHRVRLKLGQAESDGDVPQFLVPWMLRIAEMIDPGMSVVDFKKLGLQDMRQIMRGQSVVEVRVVNVGQNRLAKKLSIHRDGAEVIAHRLHHRVSVLRLDGLVNVDGIDVDLMPFKTVRDFLGLDE
ncbi:hypothetical protein [Rubritalea profundi]|uniref:hypothetical protein n=1 Tax=Rubritalea profundi TaxID=1658618 RepID=UPI00101AECCC|nr:hypothetical protein [Rubritalea profundi]